LAPPNDRPAPRGSFIDLGGRRIHLVRSGPAMARPTVLLEAGSFGFSADWAVVQAQLAARGVRSLAYDRAGLGLSDAGPQPRDGAAIALDLERLLAAAGEAGPFVLVGHSMAGLHVQLFAGRNRDRVAGVVLVDAITAGAASDPAVRIYAAGFGAVSRVHGALAGLGLLKPFRRWGDMIGLTPNAAAHKRWAFGHGPHNRAAAAEVAQWDADVAQAEAAGPFDPAWPVAVVTAGPRRGLTRLRALQAEPAERSAHGYQDPIARASHADMIGVRFAWRVVEAIDHVRRAAPTPEA
jgi:pimeloyl-ACP methyl ester carboxylesterase